MNNTITTTRTETSIEKSCTTILGGASVILQLALPTNQPRYVVILHVAAGMDIGPSAFRTDDKSEAVAKFNEWVQAHLVTLVKNAQDDPGNRDECVAANAEAAEGRTPAELEASLTAKVAKASKAKHARRTEPLAASHRTAPLSDGHRTEPLSRRTAPLADSHRTATLFDSHRTEPLS